MTGGKSSVMKQFECDEMLVYFGILWFTETFGHPMFTCKGLGARCGKFSNIVVY